MYYSTKKNTINFNIYVILKNFTTSMTEEFFLFSFIFLLFLIWQVYEGIRTSRLIIAYLAFLFLRNKVIDLKCDKNWNSKKGFNKWKSSLLFFNHHSVWDSLTFRVLENEISWCSSNQPIDTLITPLFYN